MAELKQPTLFFYDMGTQLLRAPRRTPPPPPPEKTYRQKRVNECFQEQPIKRVRAWRRAHEPCTCEERDRMARCAVRAFFSRMPALLQHASYFLEPRDYAKLFRVSRFVSQTLRAMPETKWKRLFTHLVLETNIALRPTACDPTLRPDMKRGACNWPVILASRVSGDASSWRQWISMFSNRRCELCNTVQLYAITHGFATGPLYPCRGCKKRACTMCMHERRTDCDECTCSYCGLDTEAAICVECKGDCCHYVACGRVPFKACDACLESVCEGCQAARTCAICGSMTCSECDSACFPIDRLRKCELCEWRACGSCAQNPLDHHNCFEHEV
jgi:hypothetical protein